MAAARYEAQLRQRYAAARHPRRGDRARAQPRLGHVPRHRRRLSNPRLPRRSPRRLATLGRSHRTRCQRQAGRGGADSRTATVTALQRAIKPAKARKPASTAGKSAVTWILLKDALALIEDAYQNSR